MLEDFKISHLQGLFVFILLVAVLAAMVYYINLITTAQKYAQDSYECGREYSVQSLDQQVDTEQQARQVVSDYLASRNMSLGVDSLTVVDRGDFYRVTVPEAVYSGKRCTFREAGQQPPACIGKWFDLKNGSITMEYGYPCN